MESVLLTREKVRSPMIVLDTFTDPLPSYSVLPALSLDGIIHVKIVENAFNTESFNDFIRGLLLKMNPYDPLNHNPNSVIILDNCRIHKSPEMIQMVLDQ